MFDGTILIIDDEPTNLAALETILGDDYRLAFARSGAEGLAAARKHCPSLILLDIEMPGMDGYAVCRALKADPSTENAPVIFVSSLGDVGDEAEGFACGAVDYIIKPVSPALVLARVSTHLSLVRATTLQHYVTQLELEKVQTARLTRIHAVLSGTNSAIVRIHDSQALLHEACRIAVAHGGFGIAWIGLAVDAGSAITLAASEGEDIDNLIGTSRHALDTSAPAIGFHQQVMRSGLAVVCDDVRIVAEVDVSCADALKRGFLSLVALPIGSAQRMKGVLVLYGREAGNFDADEMKLLGELAGDISFALEAIDNEKRVNFLSCYDALTGLASTALFIDRLDQLLAGARQTSDGVVVIAINIERFKQLNDALGRHTGDQVLKTVANRLNEGLSHPYTVARIAGDAFMLAGVHPAGTDAGALCVQIIKRLGLPIAAGADSIHVAVRLGAATFPNDGQDADSLFRYAEAALKQSRVTLSRFCHFSQELNAKMAGKAELEKMLTEALSGEQFVLYYQAKIDLRTGRIAGAEALIRWHHPTLGLVEPMKFIPLAEETGQIVAIGDWVIRSVCAQQAAWQSEAVDIVPVALNLSALQFKEGNVLETLRTSLATTELDTRWVELELTETLVMQNPETAQQIMRAFRALGLRLSLDDFGTGYSSLAYLKRFPFDYVKIDRAFVTDITQNPDDAAIATAVIAMAHSLHMQVIAEGVETEAQLDFLRARGCDYMQGYYFSRPIPADQFRTMLSEGRHLVIAPTGETVEQTLLVVDNDPAFIASIKRLLRHEPYGMIYADSGPLALDLLASKSVQVVLSSQHMPLIHGKEFLAIAAELHPDTMRIVLSGYTELQSVLDAVNRGEIYRFLTKPWDDEILKKHISEAFRRFRSSK